MQRLSVPPHRSLTRLAIWLVAGNLIVAAAIVAATLLALHNSREADKSLARETTENLASSLSIEIGAELRQVDNALATLALQHRNY